MVELAAEDEQEIAAEMAAQFLQESLSEAEFGSPKGPSGTWASVVRLMRVDG